MTEAEAFERLRTARVATLATIGPRGAPHLVPCVFAVVDSTIITSVDQKPKRSRALARLTNIAADPRVGLLAQDYAEQWDLLWWVRIDGTATVTAQPDDILAHALIAKYPPYRDSPPEGPWIVISVGEIRHWAAS